MSRFPSSRHMTSRVASDASRATGEQRQSAWNATAWSWFPRTVAMARSRTQSLQGAGSGP